MGRLEGHNRQLPTHLTCLASVGAATLRRPFFRLALLYLSGRLLFVATILLLLLLLSLALLLILLLFLLLILACVGAPTLVRPLPLTLACVGAPTLLLLLILD